MDTNRLNNFVLFPLREILWSAIILKDVSAIDGFLSRELLDNKDFSRRDPASGDPFISSASKHFDWKDNFYQQVSANSI